MRRHWQQDLISWTLVVARDIRNSVVAGHLLIELATGMAVSVIASSQAKPTDPVPSAVIEPWAVIGSWFDGGSFFTSTALGLFFVMFLALLLRHTWLAVAATGLVLGLAEFFRETPPT